MYCDRCGKQIDEALNFCNSCGAQLKRNEGDSKSVLNSLVVALIVIATGGLGILAGILALLLDRIGNPEPAFIFAIIYLAALFGICFMITRQISKLIDRGVPGKTSSVQSDPRPVQFPTRTTAQLEEYRQPASVVENTTRTLDKVPVGER